MYNLRFLVAVSFKWKEGFKILIKHSENRLFLGIYIFFSQSFTVVLPYLTLASFFSSDLILSCLDVTNLIFLETVTFHWAYVFIIKLYSFIKNKNGTVLGLLTHLTLSKEPIYQVDTPCSLSGTSMQCPPVAVGSICMGGGRASVSLVSCLRRTQLRDILCSMKLCSFF